MFNTQELNKKIDVQSETIVKQNETIVKQYETIVKKNKIIVKQNKTVLEKSKYILDLKEYFYLTLGVRYNTIYEQRVNITNQSKKIKELQIYKKQLLCK